MRTIFLTAIAIALSIPQSAIAQRYEGNGNNVSNLGSITASSNAEASRLCRRKGGNIVVHHGSGLYSCYFAQQVRL